VNFGFTQGGNAVCRIRTHLANLWNDESGISSVEYALLLAFVAAGIIVAAELLSNAVENEMEDTATCIETGTTGCN
jgi:Flp pilus assembly pilin Flp